MPKRRLILGILALGILAALIFHFIRPREPSYQGRSLTHWLEMYSELAPRENEQAAIAIRQIGTNAIPGLLRSIQYHRSPWKDAIRDAAWRLPYSAKFERFIVDKKMYRANAAMRAFRLLGPDAKAAIQDLTHIMNESTANGQRAAFALALIGPDAFPSLFQALTNRQTAVRTRSITAIHCLGTNAIPVVPLLVQFLGDEDSNVRASSALALGDLQLEAPRVVPALLAALNDKKSNVRSMTAYALGLYGKQAGSAVAPLLNLLKDTNSPVYEQEQVILALRQIAPEALRTNAPPK